MPRSHEFLCQNVQLMHRVGSVDGETLEGGVGTLSSCIDEAVALQAHISCITVIAPSLR